MPLFNSTINLVDANAIVTTHNLLRQIGAKVTRTTVSETLSKHPDFPSLLSLSDSLTYWQVDHTALKLKTVEELNELPLPFVAHLKIKNGWYVLVTKLQGDIITYTQNSNSSVTTESLHDFEQKWSHIVLLAEADEHSGENDYAFIRKKEILKTLRSSFIFVSLLFLFILFVQHIIHTFTVIDWLYLITKICGITISSVLVSTQLGKSNNITTKLCNINNKVSCEDILNSPASKLWGWLSWADIGLLYFSGGLLTDLMVIFQPAVRHTLYELALVSLPYICFSIYYQKIIVKKWCPLCLVVQFILLIEGGIAITQIQLPQFLLQHYTLVLLIYILPVIVWTIFKPLLFKISNNQRAYEELIKLKNNHILFQVLLRQQMQMPNLLNNLDPIILGNYEAEHTITIVTNPYCIACEKIHNELEELLRNNKNINAHIVFACDKKGGRITEMAVHSMRLAEQGNITIALKNWYAQPIKKFDIWVKQYPVEKSQINWYEKAELHRAWCQLADITVTPTIYVDGYLLPSLYRLENLRWLINESEQTLNVPQLSI